MFFTFCQWLEQTSLGTTVRQSLWLFQTIETVHILSFTTTIASIAILALRLLGLAFREQSVSKLAARCLAWAWAGFAVQVATGFLLFSAMATTLYGNQLFRIKMLLILLAVVSILVIHVLAYRNVTAWDNAPVLPLSARFAGGLSIMLLLGALVAGRMVSYRW